MVIGVRGKEWGIDLFLHSPERTGEMSKKLHSGERPAAVLQLYKLWKGPGSLR
jgi:hypothetical protein